MTYARFDDRYDEHAKIAALSDRDYRAHSESILYCARNLNDGRIPEAVARKRWPRSIGSLISAHLWEPIEGGGYYVHDYLDWNPSKAQVLLAREARVRGGRARAQQMLSSSTSSSSADAPADAKQDAEQNGSRMLSTRSGKASPAPTPAGKSTSLPRPAAPGDWAREDWVATPAGWSDTEASLFRKLVLVDDSWAELAPSAVNKLHQKYGRPIVTMAFQRMAEERCIPQHGPYPMLEAVCQDVQAVSA